jgi:hypothetical protein
MRTENHLTTLIERALPGLRNSANLPARAFVHPANSARWQLLLADYAGTPRPSGIAPLWKRADPAYA